MLPLRRLCPDCALVFGHFFMRRSGAFEQTCSAFAYGYLYNDFVFLCIGSCQYRPICRVRRHARRNAQWCACRAVCPRHMIGYLHFDAAAVCTGSFMLPGRLAANSLAPTTLKRILAARPAPHRPRIVCAGTPASLPSSYNSQSNAKLRQNTIALQKEVFRPDDEVRIR